MTDYAFLTKAAEMLTRFEGRIPYMYCDAAGVVTVGIGHALFTVEEAMSLPFLYLQPYLSAARCAPAAVAQEYQRVKEIKLTAKQWHMAALRLRDDTIVELLDADIHRFLRVLGEELPDFDQLPFNARLAALDIAFNCGSLVQWPKFRAALEARDWHEAAAECRRPAVSEARNEYVQGLLLDLIAEEVPAELPNNN